MVPDIRISDALTQQLSSLGLKPAVFHTSGRPWIFDSDTHAWSQRQISSNAIIASPRPTEEILQSARVSGNGFSSLDALAREIGATSFFLASTPAGVRAQGTLSTQHQFFWAMVGGVPLASNTLTILHSLIGPEIDQVSLALSLMNSRPIQSFAPRTPWKSIAAAEIGSWLHFDGSAPPRSVRWWREPAQDLDASSGPAAVRLALQQTISDSTDGQSMISADLSGGLDSTSLCFLLDTLDKELRTFRTSSLNDANDESRRARHVAEVFGLSLHEFPPLAETSSAFTLEHDEDPASVLQGPLVWAGSHGYLRALVPEVAAQGSATHFTGLGGDELFDMIPGIFRRLRREGRRVALSAAWRLHAQSKSDPRSMFAAVFDQEAYQDYLTRALDCLHGTGVWKARDAYNWFPPVSFPAWMSEQGRELILEAFAEVIDRGLEPLGTDPLGQQVIESISFQGGILRQFDEIFPDIHWQAPFTDQRVVEATLRSPASMRMDDRLDKSLLAAAVSDIAPAGFFTKRGRGDFTTDVYDEHRRQRAELVREFQDSRLVDSGLVEPDMVKSALYEPSSSDVGLFDVESIVVAERWLRSAESLGSLAH
ncbi:asparagine synthase-related protein [Brachybacterium fresconis]|uniref:asparagine synthase (glutamine-hydrolyzing) n=2 Tax=Brachybacterium fresconis TaxID=173363 RepID=A0ABS4YGV6_9MICO|nr:asparagine synthase-related protein [Brachybacterium fresconis]MBP2407850.1 asparagine synthase (glutamine-hydrolyzing) [Brachybacterium fresconis]